MVWDGVQVQNIQVQAESSRQGLAVPPQNVLRTFRMRSHVDLSRGLDYLRWGENLGPIFARTTHLNHDAFTYTINVKINIIECSIYTAKLVLWLIWNKIIGAK